MAKLADCYSVYEIQAQQNSTGPAIAGGRAAGETRGPDGQPAGEIHLRSSGQPGLSCIGFPAVLWVLNTYGVVTLSS